MIEGLSPNSRIQVILIPGFAGFDALGQLEYIERSPQNVCADESVCDSTSESHPFLKARINRETAEAQLPTRRTIARKGMVIATAFPSSRRECRSSRAVPSDVSRMPETFLSAGVYTLCAEHCESGRCRWISGRKNGSYRPWEQIRCDPGFWVFMALRKFMLQLAGALSLLLLLLLACITTTADTPANVAGTWNIKLSGEAGSANQTVELKQQGERSPARSKVRASRARSKGRSTETISSFM